MTHAFDQWDLHLFYHDVHGFCATDLSAFYLDVLKDTLYTDLPDSPARRSAQTALWRLLLGITGMIAPVLTFTADEVWQECRKLDEKLPESIQLTDWPEPDARFDDADLQQRWNRLLRIREEVNRALEQVKAAGQIDQPLEADVSIYAPAEELKLLNSFPDTLKEILIVSEVEVDEQRPETNSLSVEVTTAAGDKCERCWMRSATVGTVAAHPTICRRCAQRVEEIVTSASSS